LGYYILKESHMEYTTFPPNRPPVLTGESDGALLNPLSEGPELVIGSPNDLHALPGCPACVGNGQTEGQAGACPHCQACAETLRAWLACRGQYQRPDVTAYDRIDIARRYFDPDRAWGEVVGMAEEYALSRTSIYNIAERVRVLFEPRVSGPVPCLKNILPCVAQSQTTAPEESLSPEQAATLLHRLILTAVFPGGVTMRPLEEMLAEAPLPGRSAPTIWRSVSEAGAKAHHLLSQIDYSDIALPRVLVAIDETFFDGYPILLVVEPVSLSICDFYVPPDGDYASATWEPLLLLLQEDHHLPIYGGLGDGAKAYPGTLREIMQEAQRFSEDTFHTLLDLGTLRRKLENSAYRAFRAEYQAARQVEKEDTPETQAKLRQAKAESLRQAEWHDAFETYAGWVADAFQMVDLRSGEVRDRAINTWLMDAAIEAMAQLDHPDVVQMSERLARHQKYLLNYLDWLAEHLAPLRAELHHYLADPDLEKAVLQAVARTWRLEHEVKGMQRRAFRPAWQRAQHELAIWVAGDDFLERWGRQVHTRLEWVQRTSSAAENINSILKPLLARKKHFGSAESLSHFVALFVLWHNLRVFKEGKREGHSPFDILGIDLGEKDWRTLLGYPPVR
jgi:hypothetical protein